MIRYQIINLLLILFFIANGMNGYADLLRWTEPFILFFILSGFAVLAALAGRMAFRDKAKASVFAFVLLFFLLFSRVIFSSLKEQIFLHLHASWFLMGCLIVIGVKYYGLRKYSSASLEKLYRYIRITCTILILYESSFLIYHLNSVSSSRLQNDPIALSPWSSKEKPNIHVFLFDEYQGNKGLEKAIGFKNQVLVDFLKEENFTVPVMPSSSYSTTFFSIPSLFVMDKLKFSDGSSDLDERKTIMSNKLLREQNTLLDFLRDNGYSIRNNSIFDLPGEPAKGPAVTAINWFDFQYLKTLPGWMISDLLHVIPSNGVQFFLGTFNARLVNYNHEVYHASRMAIKSKDSNPQFTFNHFLLPHPPVLLDSMGNTRNLKKSMYEFNQDGEAFVKSYKEYILYANRVIRTLIADINANDPNAVIMILSDHGSRNLFGKTEMVFNIQWAIRVPGHNLQVEKEANLINSFRIVLNQIAGLNLRMVNAEPSL